MNVGQVEFSIMADGLDATMRKVQQLESVANKIDGKTLKIRADAQLADVEQRLRNIQKMKFDYKNNFFNALGNLQKVQPKLNKITDDIMRVKSLGQSEIFKTPLREATKEAGTLTKRLSAVGKLGKYAPLSNFSKSLKNVRQVADALYQFGDRENGRAWYTKGKTQWEGMKDALAKQGDMTKNIANLAKGAKIYRSIKPMKDIADKTDKFGKAIKVAGDNARNYTSRFRKYGSAIKQTSDSYKRYYDTAQKALPKMMHMQQQYSGEAKKWGKIADWDKYYRDMGNMDRVAAGYRLAKGDLQALSKQGEKTMMRDVPQYAKNVGNLVKSVQSMGRKEGLNALRAQSDELGKINKLIDTRRSQLQFGAKTPEQAAANEATRKQLAGYKQLYTGQKRYIDGMIADGEKYQQALEHRTSSIARFGSRLQSLGNTMQRFTSPFMNVYRGLTMGLGYRALGKLMEGIQGSFERYDTMRTYDKVLNQLGMDASKKFKVGMGKARTAVDNLEQSVLGLPTGLDEMVSSMRRYAGATGDVEKATKLAIAANNSFIAGQVDERSKLFTERQLLSLAGGAELASTQWDSLRRNAPLAMRAVANAMKMNVQDMVDGLKKGKIKGQEFLDVFINVGTQGKISKAAQKMKMTWDAVSQNISNAFHRMGAGILDTLDTVFKKTTGRDFLQTVLGVDKNGNAVGGGIKDFIDGISQSIQDFIKANPTALTDFFNDFKSIDWKGILQGYADFAKFWIKTFTGLGKVFGGKGLIGAMLWGNIAGRTITGVGGLIRGLAGALARLSLLGKGGVLTKIGNFFAKLVGFGKFALGTEVAANMANMAKAGGAAKTAALSWKGVANNLVHIAAIPAVAWAFKTAAEGLKELKGVKFNTDMVGTVTTIGIVLTAMGQAVSTFGSTLLASKWAAIGGAVGAGIFLAIGKTFELFGTGVKSIVDAVKTAGEIEVPDDTQITNIVKAVGKISKAFDTTEFGSIKKWVDSKSLESQMKAIEQVADSFESIKKLGKVKIDKGVLDKAVTNFKEIGTFANDLAEFFSAEEEQEMGYSARYKGKNYNGKGGEKLPWATFKQQIRDFGETMENMVTGLSQIPEVMRKARNIQKVYKNITAENQETPLDWAIVKERIRSVADGLYGLMSTEKGSAWDRLNQVAESAGQANLDNVINVMDKMPKLVNAIWRTWQNIKDSPLFGENNVQKLTTENALGMSPTVNADPIYQFETKIGRVIDAVGRIQGKLANVDAESFNQDTDKINSALQFVNSAINRMQTLSTSGAETAGNVNLDQFDVIGEKIAGVIGKIKGQLTGADKMREGAKTFNQALNKISRSVTKMSGLSFDQAQLDNFTSAIGRIKRAIRKFRELPTKVKARRIKFTVNGDVNMNGLAGQISSKWQTVMDAWNKIKSQSKSVTMKIQGNVDTGMLAWDLAGKIQSAIDGIQSYYTKNITVRVNANAQVSGTGGIMSGAASIYNNAKKLFGGNAHTGGLITGHGKPLYRAMGGFTYMTPRGTDTVPAMLTPGEYVVKKKAVDTYGARFFQALNHMDLTRALNSISVRAGQMITPASSTTINNTRTTNNNDNSKTTHNTNVTVNGLGMASRFVSALQ